MNWKDKTAVVTGASSGIGEATARMLAEKGLKVLLVARRLERLEKLAGEIVGRGGRARALSADLTKENERLRIFEDSKAVYGDVDVLVNNAGFGWYGFGVEMPWKTAWEMLQVNVEAVVQLSLLFLEDMRRRNAGHIINVGSISGSIPSQGIALYGATKSFLDNFTTALYREMAGTRVKISVIRAGPVKTEFGEAALTRKNSGRIPTEKMGVSAESIAARIWALLRHPRRVVYIPGILRFVPWIELSFGWIIDRIGPLLLKKARV